MKKKKALPADWSPAKRRQKDLEDRGYPSQEREEQLQAQGYRGRIKRKGSRNQPRSECQQRRNHNIAKVRARVEHIFAAIEQMGGKRLRTIGQARASFALTMMVVTYNIRRLTFLERGLIRAAVCP